MKRGWIALGLIAAVIALSGLEYLFTANAAHIYTEILNEADACMESGDSQGALSLTERLDHRFGEDKNVLHIFSFHSDINTIGGDLAALRRYAQSGSIPEYLAVSAQTKRRIFALLELRTPRLGNIL